jgi:glycine/D-amino acid oxidase-like deaminating enzyme
VVVVGGGLLGVSAAYHLARAGVAPLLLEAGEVGAGATGRSAGMVVPGLAVPHPFAAAVLGAGVARDAYAATVAAVALVRELVDRERLDCDLAVDGLLTLGLGDAQCAGGRMLAAALAADGFAARVVERDELGELIATPVAEEVGGGLFLPDAATVDPARLVAGLAGSARAHGAAVVPGVAVRGLAAAGDRVRLDTAAGPVEAAAVVLAVNAWTPALLPAVPVVPARAQMLAHAPTAPVFRVPVTAAVGEHGEYWRQRPDGVVVVGGRRDRDAADRTTDQTPTDAVQRAVEQVLPALFPALALPPVRTRWAGAMALTGDGIPVADRVPGVPGAWFAVGCNGHGLALATALGRDLATAVVDGTAPAALAPYAADRPSLR